MELIQGAHEAIRPIYLERETGELNHRAQRIYTLIRNHTIETCMVPAQYNCIQARITTCSPYVYTHCAEQMVFPGWHIVSGHTRSSEYSFLQRIKPGVISFHTLHSRASMIETKPHYTEANLVYQLEKKGIGRPSTYAGIVDKLQERGYVKKTNVSGKSFSCVEFKVDDAVHTIESIKEYGVERGKLILQPLGREVVEILNQRFTTLFQYDYSKHMEETLDLIAKGQCGWEGVCQTCLDEINQSIPDSKHVTTSSSTIGSKDILLVISKEATLRQGKYSPYIYYKTNRMKKPKFIPITPIPQSIQEAKEWLKLNHNIIV
jgi:DNA topoisomerase-1